MLKFHHVAGGVTLALLLTPFSQAQLASHGPLNPYGFPSYYTDADGLSLEQGLDINDPFLVVDPPANPAAPLSVADQNFPGESFYFLGNASVATSGGEALLVMAIEGVFGGPLEEIIDGDQTVFSRVRVRVDVPDSPASAGTYTVIHPYGVETFEVTAADVAATAGRRVINWTNDCLHTQVGGVIVPSCGPGVGSFFTTPLTIGLVGPTFLQWDTGAPPGYIGDPAVLHTVTGSPTGENRFAVIGPGVAPNGMVETDLFSLQGKIIEPVADGGNGTIVCEGSAGCPCGNDSALASGRGCQTTSGAGMAISGAGTTSVAANDLVVRATSVPPGNSGIFYVGDVLGGPNNLFDGHQCAGGFTIRFQGHIAGPDGVVEDTGFVGQNPVGPLFFMPGKTVYFQYFSRDNQAGPSPCGGGANLSAALRLTLTP